MRRGVTKNIALFFAVASLALATLAHGDPPRKVKTQVQPILPDMARQMNLKGTVRLEIEIGADGAVKSTKALGGHPLLILSAEQAVRKWRYEPGPPTKAVVEFNFHRD